MNRSDSKLSPIKIALLNRTEFTEEGTFGTLKVGKYQFLTGELPWNENKTQISCIPDGEYRCVFTYSNKFKRKCYEVLNVPGRTGIRIHSANVMGDPTRGLKTEVDGCIALGKIRGEINGQRAILRSRDAVLSLEMFLQAQDFILNIQSAGYKRIA